MEEYGVLILLIVMWITLSNQIGKLGKSLETLKQELESWRKSGREQLTDLPELHPESPESVTPPPPPLLAEQACYEPEEAAGEVIVAQHQVAFSGPETPGEAAVPETGAEQPDEASETGFEGFEPEYPGVDDETAADLSNPEAEKEQVVPPPPPFVTRKKKQVNYEKYVGENLFGKIGILVLVIGIGLFVKYAIDQNWINEIFRTILGFAAGGALLFVAGRLQKKYRTFSSLLAGGAFAVFYVTVAIAFHYYNLFSQTAAFILLVAITVLMSALALLYDRRELAIIALVGGFIAPFLINRGEGNYVVLFTYLAILDAGMFVLSFRKKWAELPVIAFAFTYLVMGLYTWQLEPFYRGEAGVSARFIKLLAFATLFYFLFLLPVMSVLKSSVRQVNRILLSVVVANNFLYLFFGLYYLSFIQSPVRLSGLLTLFVAIVNLLLVIWLRKEKQEYRFLVYTLLGVVLTFVSITVPVQLSGRTITLFWAAEMVLLLWLYLKSKIRLYEYFSFLLVICTFVSYLIDALSFYTVYPPVEQPGRILFLNPVFATAAFAGAAFVAFALLMQRNKPVFESAKILTYSPWNALLLSVGLAILYYSMMCDLYRFVPVAWRAQALLLCTTGWLAVLPVCLKKRFPIARNTGLYILAAASGVLVYWLNFLFIDTTLFGSEKAGFLTWLSAGTVVFTLWFIARLYYTAEAFRARKKTGFTVFINVASVLVWIGLVRLFLLQSGLPDELNAGLSIALTIAGAVQMALGMRLHLKVMRIISLFTFGLVLLKLFLADLWAMPTVGKILVFVLLGVILLVLSFLYQKLKDVLFKEDEAEKES
ncbi:MAG: DUF2339 domain-containing protein [Parabacteroides sp.]|nr:DUF2339 domain-containing protein [Parabacteroides sp.]